MDNIEKEIRFQELYNHYYKLVGTYLHKNIHNPSDREDVFQQIGLGIGEKVDKIRPGKEHAFIYKVIMNQIHKLYYYSTRDRRKTTSVEAENSESDEEFSLVDISKEIREQDDYEYLEIMDAIESILTEKEYQIFLADFQGITNKPWIIKSDIIFPLTKLEFEGEMYLAPAQYAKHLENRYGDIWTMPNNIITHQHLNLSKADRESLETVVNEYKDLL